MTKRCKTTGSNPRQDSLRPGLSKVGWMNQVINNCRNNCQQYNCLPKAIYLQYFFRNNISNNNTNTHF